MLLFLSTMTIVITTVTHAHLLLHLSVCTHVCAMWGDFGIVRLGL